MFRGNHWSVLPWSSVEDHPKNQLPAELRLLQPLVKSGLSSIMQGCVDQDLDRKILEASKRLAPLKKFRQEGSEGDGEG